MTGQLCSVGSYGCAINFSEIKSMMGKINLVILGIVGERLLGGAPSPLQAHLARSESLSAAFQGEKCLVRRGFAPRLDEGPSGVTGQPHMGITGCLT